MNLTYRYRIKDSNSRKQLDLWSSKVNFVWNYCRETASKAWRRDRRILTGYDLNYLTAGSSKELGLPAQTIQAICEQFARSGKQHHKLPKFRSYKRHLAWIPWKATSFKMKEHILFNGIKLKVWRSRPLGGPVKTGSFVKDILGRWYVNIICSVPMEPKQPNTNPIGLDLGMKTKITGSNGTTYHTPNISKKYEGKLAIAQRARKPKQIKKIHTKINNTRKDWTHKTTTEIVKQYNKIIIGNVKTKQIQQPKAKGFNKALYDASWFQLKTTLEYKALMLGGEYVEINEAYTTQTCSACGARTGPRGTKDLGIREWTCESCGSFHDRDHNAAKNILRLGHQSLAQGS